MYSQNILLQRTLLNVLSRLYRERLTQIETKLTEVRAGRAQVNRFSNDKSWAGSGTAVAFTTRDPGFESSHHKLFTIYCKLKKRQ